jgi:hypothetical protein
MPDYKKLSNVHEARLQRKTQNLGSRKTINSGAIATDPGDVALKHYLFDAKTVAKEQYTQTLDVRWFHKVQTEAFSKKKRGGLVAFDFGRGTAYDYIAGPLNTWIENIEYREIYADKLRRIKVLVENCIVNSDVDQEETLKTLFNLLKDLEIE